MKKTGIWSMSNFVTGWLLIKVYMMIITMDSIAKFGKYKKAHNSPNMWKSSMKYHQEVEWLKEKPQLK